MPFAIDFDDKQQEQIEHGNKLSPGWGGLILFDAYEDAQSGKLVLEWLFDAEGAYVGANAGRKCIERFDDPSTKAEKAAAVINQKIGLRASRLGIDLKHVEIPNSFIERIGWHGFGNITRREFKDDATGQVQDFFDLGFGNIFPDKYEGTVSKDAKRKHVYPSDFPKDWRIANSVPSAGGPALPGMEPPAAGTTAPNKPPGSPPATPGGVQATAQSTQDKYAAAGL